MDRTASRSAEPTKFVPDEFVGTSADQIAGSDLEQPQAGPKGGVQGWTP